MASHGMAWHGMAAWPNTLDGRASGVGDDLKFAGNRHHLALRWAADSLITHHYLGRS